MEAVFYKLLIIVYNILLYIIVLQCFWYMFYLIQIGQLNVFQSSVRAFCTPSPLCYITTVMYERITQYLI